MHPTPSTLTMQAPAREVGIAATVGRTPLIPLRHLARDLPPGVEVWAKAEWFNPSGSVKARPAWNILRTALAAGRLRGKRLLDATSGNMGIAYATFGAALGVPVTLTLPANASPERLAMLRALGAELILTDPLEGTDGAIEEARRLAEAHPDRYCYVDQYNNPANWQAHYLTTGPEILQQTEGRITHFVAGVGTSGTLMGTGRYLREHLPDVVILAVQPDGPMHGLEGLKHMPTALQPGIYDPAFPDGVIEVPTQAAYAMVRRLAQEEGLFVGPSSGAAAWAALQVASQLREGVVVTIFPDGGDRYLSAPFWEEDA